MEKITGIEQFEVLLKEHKRFFFLKHSITCPISGTAFDEFQSFLKEKPEEKGYYLVVQEARELSNYVADKFMVVHQSPQAFLFQDGQPVWNDSHWRITKQQLTLI
ncbi:bacillithiol system redox-active protein YtxJ [Bacillus sp. REN10]|uniref:bacillithiol system redox-active protein YtxJ n=1 Tax=Bacillus sp. REN10 TaxID=2782541 RepID=UPI00193BB361|nr:bacillithiol system redox-active protein YtxJ [Bacillus sp. REN10]